MKYTGLNTNEISFISEGLVEEGLCVVRAIRDRYDGKKRNPYNEIECGSNYARPMAAYALLPIFSGFEYDMTRGYIGFSPIVEGDFKALWSVGGSWGEFSLDGSCARVCVKGGAISLSSFKVLGGENAKAVEIDGEAIEFTLDGDIVVFEKTSIEKGLVVTLK